MGIVNTRPLDGDYEKSVDAMWEYLQNNQNAWEGIPGCTTLTLGGAEGGSCSDMVSGAAEAQDHKVAAIREIAKALKEYKVINLTSSPDSAKFAELVKEIAHKLPDPKKASRGVKNSNGIPQKLCARLVHILNDKVNAGISTDAPIEEQCHQAFSITRLLLLGAGSDAFNLHNELKRTFNDIKLLSSLNKEAIDNLVRQAEASKDEKFKNKTAATIKLMKSLQKSIDSIVSAVVSTLYVDLDKDYKDVLTIIENSKSNKEALERLGLPHKKENLAKALGYAFSEVTNLSVMVNQVALALKRLHMNVEQLKNSKTYEDFEEAARKVMHSIPPSEQKKFFESLEVVRQHFGKRDKLVPELSKKGGKDESSAAAVIESADEVESVESKPDNIEGGANYKSKYAKRIKDASIVRGELVKQFLKTFKLHIDKLFSHNKAIIAEFRKQNIKVDDNVNDLFNALSQVQTQLVGPDSKYMSIVLLGVTQRAQDKDRRARFIEALRYLQNVNKRIGNPALVAQNKIIDDMIAVIDKFYDTYQQSRVASKFVKGASVDGGSKTTESERKRAVEEFCKAKEQLEQLRLIVDDVDPSKDDESSDEEDERIGKVTMSAEQFDKIAKSYVDLEARYNRLKNDHGDLRTETEEEIEELNQHLNELQEAAEEMYIELKSTVIPSSTQEAYNRLDDDIARMATAQGGSEYDDMKKSIDSLGKLTDIAQDLNKSIQEIKYYVSISKIKENLKFSAKDIELNQGNYMETLGKAVANKLDTLENELEANIKALEQLRDHGFNAANNIPGYNGPNLYDNANAITFDSTVNVGGKTISGPGEALHKQIVDSRIAFCKKVYAAKRDFYKVMEAVEIYLTKFNDGMINHPDDIKDIETMLKDGEIVYDWYNEKAGDALTQAFTYARNAHPRVQGEDDSGIPNGPFITQDEKDKLVSGKVLTASELGAINVVHAADLMFNVDGVTIGERAVLNGTTVGNRAPYRSPHYPGSVLYTTDNVLDSRPLMITGKIANGAWVVDNQFEKYVDLVSKSYERMDVLKNLVSTFMMIGNKFGSVDLNKVTHIPFGEIYRILTKFLAYSSLSIYDSTHTDDKRGYYGGAAIPYYNKSDLEIAKGAPGADAQKTANALNLLSEADRGSKLDTAGYPSQVAGGMDTGEPAGLGNVNPYRVPRGDGNSGQNVQFGTELIPGRDSTHNVVAHSIGGFWSAELELFSYMINAMSAKVFMVMGVYEMMNRPFKTDVATGDPKSAFILDERRYDVPVRIITGGAEMPEIIDDALELYVRLPLLVEFYRDLLSTNGSNRGLGQNQERIGLIADFENVWRDLFHFFFIKHPNRDHSDFGNYELYELVSIINELYRSFKPRSAGKVTTTIVNELIHEINGRIGIVTYEDSKTFYENVDAILRSMDDNAQRDDVIDFKVIPDQDNTYSASGPSAKYRERGSAASSLPDPKKPYDKRSFAHHRNLLEEFLRKYYALMNNASTYRTVNDPSSGLTLVKKLKQVSHDLVQTKDANERFNLVFKTVRTEQELNDVHVLIHVVLHELIGVPLNTIAALHSTLRRLADKYNDTVAYNYANDAPQYSEFKELLKTLAVLNNSYEKYVSVSVSKDYLRVDISKLVSHVKKMVELLRSQLDRFTGVLPAGANILERYRNAITDLEEHLVHRLIEEKRDVNNETSYLADGSSNPRYPSLNKMTKNMEKIWAAVVAGSKGTGQDALLNMISNSFIFNVSAGATIRTHTAVFAGIVDQLLPGYDYSSANVAAGIGSIRLMQNISLRGQNQAQLLTGAAVNDLNRLITLLAYVMVDESNHKIYKEIINEIGNSTFSEALFNGQNIPNVGNANAINGLDDPSKVLYHSTASIIGKLLVANWKNKTEKAFLWENLSEVPIYAREKMRINLPTFVTFFKRIINDIDLIKDVLNALQLQGTGTYGTASNVTSRHQVNKTVLGDRAEIPAVVAGQIGVLDAANNNYRHRIAVLDTVKNGVMSMIRSCNKVISELGDSSPKYGDLYEKFFDDYKSAYGKEPIGLYSNLAFVLNGRLSSDYNNANKFLNAFFPTQNVGMDTNFKFKHGVRAVFGKNNKLTLKDFPFISNLVSQYNGYYKVNQKLDTSKFDELISLNTELLRYIHHSKINSIDSDYQSLVLPERIAAVNEHIFFYDNGVFERLSTGSPNNIRTYFVDASNNANAAEKLAEIVSIAEAKHQKDQLSRTISTVILPGGAPTNLVREMRLDRPDTNMRLNNTADDRKALRILNIFDMNVVPVNIHALRRELPFVSLFSYKFTFQNMVKHALRSEFMYDLSSPGYPTGDKSMKHAALLTECLQSPYRHLLLQNAADNNPSTDNQIMDIIELVYGHADLPLGRPKFLAEELFEKALDFDYTVYGPRSSHPRTVRHSKPYNVASTSAVVNGNTNVLQAKQRAIMDGFNNSTVRTIFYLVNLQRVIRLKMRQDMFWSLGPIVNNIQSIAPAVTEISNDMKKYNTTRRE